MSAMQIYLGLALLATADAMTPIRTLDKGLLQDQLGDFAEADMSLQEMVWSQMQLRMAQTRVASDKTKTETLPAMKMHKKPSVLYAVFTSGSEPYRAKLEAQMKTWAKKPIKEGRFIALGGRDYPSQFVKPGVVESVNCTDQHGGLSCKEASLIEIGAKRGVDWTFIIGEDNYVDVEKLEEALQHYDPKEMQGLGCVGCGKGIRSFGHLVSANGAWCGGCGYALSKKTVASLLQKNHGVNGLIKQYGGRDSQKMPNDMNTAKKMMEIGAKLLSFPGSLEGNASPL